MISKKTDVIELYQELQRIVDRIPPDFGGGSPLSKIFLMSYIMLEFNLKNYVEIGVYKGRSFFPMAYIAKILSGMAYGIDAYDNEIAKEHDLEDDFARQVNRFLEELDFLEIYKDVISIQQELALEENSLILREKSSTAVDYFQKNNIPIDMLHIDGNHDTIYVLEDVDLYFPLMSARGVVVMDDINWDSVKRVFDQLQKKYDVIFTNGQFAILFMGPKNEPLSLEVSSILNTVHDLIEMLEVQQHNVQSLIEERQHVEQSLMEKKQHAEQSLIQKIQDIEQAKLALKTRIVEMEKNTHNLNVLIKNMYSSNSWKITRPLRAVKRLAQRLSKFIHLSQVQDEHMLNPSSNLHIQQETDTSSQINALSLDAIRVIDRRKVSVIVISYNHERYIEQCLDGILMQKGSFNLEIIIGDDNSTDNTRNILQKYYEMYPDQIKIMPKKANLGVTKNLKRCLDACSGSYIALCEGDDYWIDEYKLQKQMEFLESNDDYSMCFSAILILWEGENKLIPFSEQKALNKTSITIEELIDVNYIGNFSCCMYRTESIRKLSSEIFDVFTVDWMFNLACGELGKIGFIKEWMSVYRKHSGGVWSGKSDLEQVEEMLPRVDIYNKLLKYKYDNEFMRYKEKLKAIKAHYQANH